MHSTNDVDFETVEFSCLSRHLDAIWKARIKGHLIIQLKFCDDLKTFLDVADDDSTWSKKERLAIVESMRMRKFGTCKVLKVLKNSGVLDTIDIFCCIDPTHQDLEHTAATIEATTKMAFSRI